MEFFEVVRHKGTVRIERKKDRQVMAIFKGDFEESGVSQWKKYFETYLAPKTYAHPKRYDAEKHFTTTQDLENHWGLKSQGPPAEL